jgi:hypothetical protein
MLTLIQPQPVARFAQTSVTEQVEETAAFAMKIRGVTVARGPAGIGKSSTVAKLLADEALGAKGFEIPATGGSNSRLLRYVATALEMPFWDMPSFGAMIERISDGRNSVPCLIVDEVQNAAANGLRMLLSLNERAGLPIVLVGNMAALKRTSSNAAAFDQIEDRITKFYDLEKTSQTDIAAVAKEWGVNDAMSMKIVLAYGKDKSLRTVSKFLQLARQSLAADDRLNPDLLKQALQYLAPGLADARR